MYHKSRLYLLSCSDKSCMSFIKVYADAIDPKRTKEWYFNMENPTSDPRLKNYRHANLRRMIDGSWYVDGTANDGDAPTNLAILCLRKTSCSPQAR